VIPVRYPERTAGLLTFFRSRWMIPVPVSATWQPLQVFREHFCLASPPRLLMMLGAFQKLLTVEPPGLAKTLPAWNGAFFRSSVVAGCFLVPLAASQGRIISLQSPGRLAMSRHRHESEWRRSAGAVINRPSGDPDG
jgi:hypothetical protein